MTLYVTSAAIGLGYVVIALAAGRHGHAHGGAQPEGHHGAHGGSSTHSSHSAGIATHSSHDAGTVAHRLQDAGAVAHKASLAEVAHAHPTHHRGKSAHQNHPSIGLILMEWLNPMSVSLFLLYFGLSGIVAVLALAIHLQSKHVDATAAAISLIVAIIFGIAIRGLVMQLTERFFAQSTVSTARPVEDAIGTAAQVTIPVQQDHTGEVLCELGSKRYAMPARLVDKTLSFKRGDRVVISDIQGGVAFIVPAYDNDDSGKSFE